MSQMIKIRKIPFEFADGVEPVWNQAQPEWSHMLNGASLTMPYLEPFLNRTLREASTQLTDPSLVADVKGFVGQEAQHYTNHRRMNTMLKSKGYAELEAVETTYTVDYTALADRSLAVRLAYCAGFETMTMGVTEWLVNDRAALFQDADPVVSSLVLWHMVEETEHKTVAFDVYQAVVGNYWLRLYGLLHGSLHVGFMTRRAYRAMLQKDGRWNRLSSRMRVWAMVGRFFVKAGGAMLAAMKPSYHPSKRSDPDWVARWQVAYERLEQSELHNAVPLLDTSTADMEPSFGH